MQSHPALKRYTSGQTQALAAYGYEVWDTLCFNLTGRRFKTGVAAKLIEEKFAWAHRTSYGYVCAVLNNVLLDQDPDNPCLRKLKHGIWEIPAVEYK